MRIAMMFVALLVALPVRADILTADPLTVCEARLDSCFWAFDDEQQNWTTAFRLMQQKLTKAEKKIKQLERSLDDERRSKRRLRQEINDLRDLSPRRQ